MLRRACPRQKPRAPRAFKVSMAHGFLQFTLSIAFRCALHRCEGQDIRLPRVLHCGAVPTGPTPNPKAKGVRQPGQREIRAGTFIITVGKVAATPASTVPSNPPVGGGQVAALRGGNEGASSIPSPSRLTPAHPKPRPRPPLTRHTTSLSAMLRMRLKEEEVGRELRWKGGRVCEARQPAAARLPTPDLHEGHPSPDPPPPGHKVENGGGPR